ncbi:MAG: quinolinate synthase [Flavobacteriaceae bacterium]|nr:MAG: quinolinate synthase [Flavobacteriaceae bacterium]
MLTLEQATKALPVNGYLKLDVPKDLDLVQEIKKLKTEKNAIILAHYYQSKEIQDLADFLGDSLQLARAAKETDAKMIVFCGVHFMSECAKILNPEKTVVLPDTLAGCSLADSCTGEGLRALREKHPGSQVVSYINCDAGVKAESDLIVTSSNAVAMIESIPKETPIIFAPDRNLGAYLNKVTGRNMILWDGACIVHEAFNFEKIAQQILDHPNAKLIAHPESEANILEMAHFVGSTSALLNFVRDDSATEFIIATEEGILHEMQKRAPGKKLIPALVDDENCSCSECYFMKRNTLEKIYLAMKYELPAIEIDEELRLKALKPIEKMLELSKNIK